jgi:ligand-binding sensor domain-containing protein
MVYDIYEDKHHILWISSYVGLFRTKNPNDYSEIEEVNIPNDSCDAGNVFVDSSKAMTFRRTPPDNQVKNAFFGFPGNPRIYVYGDNSKEFAESTLRKIIQLKNGTVLWALGDYLFIIQSDGTFEKEKQDKAIISLYQDMEGGVWIGYREKGVIYYKDASLTGKPISSLKGYSVSSVIMDAEGGIWATTLEKGIFYAGSNAMVDFTDLPDLDRKITAFSLLHNKVMVSGSGKSIYLMGDTSVSKINFPAKDKSLVTYCHYMQGNNIYLATANALLKTDSNFSAWKILCADHAGSNQFSPAIFDITGSPDHKIYANNGSALYRVDDDSLRFLDAIPGRGRTICVTYGGKIMVTSSMGLYTYTGDKIKALEIDAQLKDAKIYDVKEGPDSTLWMMTSGKGMLVYKKGKCIASLNSRNGLGSDHAYDVAFDKQGYAWVGTDNGLSRINPAKGFASDNFTTRHGLVSNEVVKVLVRDQQVWIGTDGGLCMADINELTRNKVPPPVYIAAVFVDDSTVSNKNDFAYNNNNFRFVVDGLTYKDKEIRFAYKMQGADTAWHFSSSRDIGFNELPPGKYVFEVKAVNADNTASLQPASFSFTIEDPFWLKWWFILFEVISLAGLTYLFIQVRLKAIRSREEEKTRINKLIAEYEITALRTQMNPHFIFNAINSIQHYVLQNNGREAYNYLAKFSRLIRMMLNNAQEKKLTLQQELEMLHLYIELEQLRFSKSFQFTLQVDEEIDAHQVFIPAMLIQPYVENAIWHGLMNLQDKTNAELSITIKQLGKELKVIIKDNGIGRERAKEIQKDSTHRSVGMELTRKRTEVLNRIPGEEQVDIRIMDLHDKDKQPCGTAVEITIKAI